MSARRMALTVACLAALGFLTGCAGSDPGTPDPPKASMSAHKELGDFTTIQPCAMVDIKRLPADLKAALEPVDTLDSCALRVDSTGTPIRVEVGELTYADVDNADVENKPEALPSGLQLYVGSAQQGTCAAYLRFADHIDLTSVAYATDGTGTLCATAAAVARNVAGVLAKGPVPHRTYPANSFATVDPCGLVYADDYSSLGYVDENNRFPARHECDWIGNQSATNSLTVRLIFIAGPAPDAQALGGTASQIGGRPSVTTSTTVGAAAECRIDTAGPALGATQSKLYEIAQIHVTYDNHTTGDACQAGTALADVVWLKLP
ncbi:MAG TPA: hypothetical protein VJ914_17370 [Pseudonocardiaceae bacterium]|nr:hypothetical protein [Pseudonocardiaceae bacterium]